MINITAEALASALGIPAPRADVWTAVLNETMERFAINTPARQAGFLAQVGHESAKLSVLVENLNYSADGLLATYPRHFNQDQATAYARQPEKIANRVYAARLGNGDEASGDGWRFRGRGLIQVTGRSNYQSCGHDLELDLEADPDLLQQPTYAALSAGWFWNKHNLNALADAKDVLGITKCINGGTNGLDDRQKLYARAMSTLDQSIA